MPYLDRVFDAAREAVGAEGVAEVCESEGRRTKNGRRVKGAWACGWVARKRTTLEVGCVVALRDGDAAGLCGGKLLAFGGNPCPEELALAVVAVGSEPGLPRRNSDVTWGHAM